MNKNHSNEKVREVFIKSVAKNLTPATLLSLENCLDCKSCGSACAWHITTGEKIHHPLQKKNLIKDIYKSHITYEGKIASKLGLRKKVSYNNIVNAMDSYWKCTACGRCTLACPMALNNRDVVHLARAAYNESGLSKSNNTLAKIEKDTIEKRHSFGLTHSQIYLRVGFFLKNENIDVPIDIKGSDYLFVCPSVGNTKIPDYGIKLPQILNASGIDYTISSRLIETGTEVNHIVDNFDESKKILLELEAEATRLDVKYIIVAECGCDVRTFYAETSKFLKRPLKFPVVHVDSLILENIENGNLPVEQTNSKVTFHDPCKLSRQAGLGEMERKLLHKVSSNVVEMTPNKEMNYCCNGGSGPMRLPENTNIRRTVSKLKATQIKNTYAKYVITPCAVCMLTLEDICNTYNLGTYAYGETKRMSFMMFEIVYNAVAKALQAKNELYKFEEPKIFRDKNIEFKYNNGFGKVLDMAQKSPSIKDDIKWLFNDEIIHRYLNEKKLNKEDLEDFVIVNQEII